MDKLNSVYDYIDNQHSQIMKQQKELQSLKYQLEKAERVMGEISSELTKHLDVPYSVADKLEKSIKDYFQEKQDQLKGEKSE